MNVGQRMLRMRMYTLGWAVLCLPCVAVLWAAGAQTRVWLAAAAVVAILLVAVLLTDTLVVTARARRRARRPVGAHRDPDGARARR